MNLYVHLIEVLPDRGRWKITVHYTNGTEGALGRHRFKYRAVAAAREISRGIAEQQGKDRTLELQIRNRKGQIRQKDSYGSDPRSTRG
jgi:hypothetical protein